jgi:aminoglycoside phosphotransferase (APT) family kinase protein
MVAHAETAYGPWLGYGGALLTELELDPLLRELAILQVAKQVGSEYEWVQHDGITRAVGGTAEQVAAVEAADPSVIGIVHGDYRLDNCLVGADDRIHAVVDWEMATLGDTRTDLALMMVYDQLSASAGGDIVSDVAKAQGYPSNEQQLARYAAVSGREPGDMGFHLALAYFKLAVILEGIHYRFLKGQTVGEGFDRIGEGFDLIVAAGLDAIDKG